MSIEIKPVETRGERRSFVRFPWRIYPGRYPAWVPPLISEELKRIDPTKNPFFGHGDVQLFLAQRDGEPVGRIAAVENTLHNEFHGDNVGFFGMFEALDDAAVAGALLDRAADWVKARGLSRLRGPANFSTNEECGLLVENFEDPPYVMMPYHPPYYAGLLTAWGLEKAKDLLAYQVRYEGFDRRRFAMLDRAVQRSGLEIRVRGLDMKRFDEEVALVRELYNDAWERNWGFVPMTDAEVDHMAAQLKPVVDPELVLIAEVEDRPVGFALSLPDINQAIRHVDGRLWPFGILKLLWHMRRINGIRVLTLGVREEYRGTPLSAVLYSETYRRGVERGHRKAESSWILEDNVPMLKGVEKMGFRHYKTYRMYERPLT